eukprot:277538-Lingulodinium_polyedra.AAC.1
MAEYLVEAWSDAEWRSSGPLWEKGEKSDRITSHQRQRHCGEALMGMHGNAWECMGMHGSSWE